MRNSNTVSAPRMAKAFGAVIILGECTHGRGMVARLRGSRCAVHVGRFISFEAPGRLTGARLWQPQRLPCRQKKHETTRLGEKHESYTLARIHCDPGLDRYSYIEVTLILLSRRSYCSSASSCLRVGIGDGGAFPGFGIPMINQGHRIGQWTLSDVREGFPRRS